MTAGPRLLDVAGIYGMWIPRRNGLLCDDAPHAATTLVQ
jgi:hypothetical protein